MKISWKHSPISHQGGAAFSTLSAQIIAFTATVKPTIITQIAKEQTPTFQVRNMLFDIEARTRMQARKLEMGTRGYVGSTGILKIHYDTYCR